MRATIPMMPMMGLNNDGLHARTPEQSMWQTRNAEIDLSGRLAKRRGLQQWGATLKEPASGGLRWTEIFNNLNHFSIPDGMTTSNMSISLANSRVSFVTTGTGAGTEEVRILRYAQSNDGTADNAEQMSYRFMVRTRGALPADPGSGNDYAPNLSIRTSGGNAISLAFFSTGIFYYSGGIFNLVANTDIDNGQWHIIELRQNTLSLVIYVDDVLKATVTGAAKPGHTVNANQITFRAKLAASTYGIEYDFVQGRSTVTTPFTVSNVTNLFDWRSSQPIEKHLLAVAGSTIYVDSGHVGAWLGLDFTTGTGLTTFVPFFDKLIILHPNQQPRQWSGVGIPSLLSGAPNVGFGVEHKGRLFVAGRSTHPLRIYFSGADNLEDWTTEEGGTFTTSGFLDIPDRIGTEITGMLGNFYGDLMVWTHTSIWRVTGDFVYLVAPNGPDYAPININTTVGVTGPRAFSRVSNDCVFLGNDGVHSIQTTQNYGDLTESFMSAPIRNRWRRDMGFSLDKIVPVYSSCLVHVPEEDRTYIGVQFQGDASPNHVFGFSHNLQQWYGPLDISGQALHYVRLGFPERPCLMVGDTSGRVASLTNDSKQDFGVTPYTYHIQSAKLDGRSLDPSLSRNLKKWVELRLFVLARTNHNFTIGYETDEEPILPESPLLREQSILQNLAARMALDNNFVLDVARLSDSEAITIMTISLDIPGRWLNWYIKQDGAGEDAIIVGAEVDFTVDRVVQENN